MVTRCSIMKVPTNLEQLRRSSRSLGGSKTLVPRIQRLPYLRQTTNSISQTETMSWSNRDQKHLKFGTFFIVFDDILCAFSSILGSRLNVAPYSIIHVNDRITINGKTATTVAAVRKYSRLQSVFEAENLDALLPQSSFVGSGTFNVLAAAERHCRQYFSAEEEEQFGIVVFQLAVTSSGPKSQEEWSSRFLGLPYVPADV
jgi:ASC-1-like (ASCH) protein